MDNGVARVDQNPVAMRHAFNTRSRQPRIFASDNDPLGDRSNMDVRAAGRYKHDVSDGSFAVQINCDDVFGFRVVEALQDIPHEKFGLRLQRAERRMESVALRKCRGCQRSNPPLSRARRARPVIKMGQIRDVFNSFRERR